MVDSKTFAVGEAVRVGGEGLVRGEAGARESLRGELDRRGPLHRVPRDACRRRRHRMHEREGRLSVPSDEERYIVCRAGTAPAGERFTERSLRLKRDVEQGRLARGRIHVRSRDAVGADVERAECTEATCHPIQGAAREGGVRGDLDGDRGLERHDGGRRNRAKPPRTRTLGDAVEKVLAHPSNDRERVLGVDKHAAADSPRDRLGGRVPQARRERCEAFPETARIADQEV